MVDFAGAQSKKLDLKLIQDTCKKTSQTDPNIKYDFCVSALRADKKSITADLQGLGVVSAQLASANATQTQAHIAQLLKKKNLDPFDKDCLKACQESYSDAIYTLNDVVKAFQSKRYGDANIWVASVMDDSTTCETGFKEKPGHTSPLTKYNADLFQLGAIALAISHLLLG
ncbi:hypothetical protein ACLOJK_000804 [Asimina triloba]